MPVVTFGPTLAAAWTYARTPSVVPCSTVALRPTRAWVSRWTLSPGVARYPTLLWCAIRTPSPSLARYPT